MKTTLKLTMVLATALGTSVAAELPSPVSAATIKCNGLAATIVGTAKGETLVGTAGRDVIHARGGNDTVFGRGGNDVICGGGGDDVIKGESGNDKLRGGSGRDTVIGGDGADVVKGDTGIDTLDGRKGNDVVLGGDNPDKIWGGDGADKLRGGRGNDIIRGGNQADTIWGDANNDRIYGDNGVDTMYGGPGNDLIMGGGGGGTAYGDAGLDACYDVTTPDGSLCNRDELNYSGASNVTASDLLSIAAYCCSQSHGGGANVNGDYYTKRLGFFESNTDNLDSQDYEFNTSRDYTRFAAWAGISDSADSSCTARFDVFGDGGLISQVFVSFGQVKPVTANITNVLRLEIVVTSTSEPTGTDDCGMYFLDPRVSATTQLPLSTPI